MYYAYSNHILCYDNTKSLVSMLVEKLRDSDILGPSCTRSLYSSNYESFLNLEIPSKFNVSSLICKNYYISHLAKHDVIHVPSGYGVSMSQSLVEDTNDSDMKSSSSQTEDCLSPNSSFSRRDEDVLDRKNDVLEDLSSTFDLYSIEIENTKKRKKRNSYADIMPLIKELCPLLDSDGSDNQVKKIRSFITNEINILKENVCTRKKNIKEHLYLQMSNFRKDKKHMVLIIFSFLYYFGS